MKRKKFGLPETFGKPVGHLPLDVVKMFVPFKPKKQTKEARGNDAVGKCPSR
jgi:hypothetical protein